MKESKKRKQWVPLADYAKSRGVSDRMIRKDISKGRIPKKYVRMNGRGYEINFAGAESSLGANKKGGEGSALPDSPVVDADESQDEKQAVISESGIQRCGSLTEAQKLNQEYAAALKKIEYEEKSKKLLDAEATRAAWMYGINAAKQIFLGIRSKITPIVREQLPDIEAAEAVCAFVDSEIHRALEELSNTRF